METIKTICQTKQFRQDKKRMQRRSKNPHKLDDLVDRLTQGDRLPRRNCNHKLFGSGYWDCHIEPDWVLIYKIECEALVLVATGTHAGLF
jgi:mRNA interferase YafQ